MRLLQGSLSDSWSGVGATEVGGSQCVLMAWTSAQRPPVLADARVQHWKHYPVKIMGITEKTCTRMYYLCWLSTVVSPNNQANDISFHGNAPITLQLGQTSYLRFMQTPSKKINS